MNIKKAMVAFGCCLLCSSAAYAAESAENASKLYAFFQRYLDESFQLRPLDATRLGDHRFDDRLDDLSAPARRGWLEHARRTLAALPGEVEPDKLARPAQIDFEIFRDELVATIWLAENTHPFEEDPRVYNDYINDGVYLLLTQSTLPKETNIRNCIARISQIPKVLAAARANLRNPPRNHTETAIRQNHGAISFYERDLFELAGETPQLAALRAAVQRLIARAMRGDCAPLQERPTADRAGERLPTPQHVGPGRCDEHHRIRLCG